MGNKRPVRRKRATAEDPLVKSEWRDRKRVLGTFVMKPYVKCDAPAEIEVKEERDEKRKVMWSETVRQRVKRRKKRRRCSGVLALSSENRRQLKMVKLMPSSCQA